MDKRDEVCFEGPTVTKLLGQLDDGTLERVAEALRAGDLVAFPTETVYGLGANASQNSAVQAVYRIKGRPAQDPLIVHCSTYEQTTKYISEDATKWQRAIHEVLARRFWPGPLTLILPCNPRLIVSSVTGGTGWVGLRCPNHPIAKRLLEFADCPVAAPSANLFGHVSPTTAQHVFDDFPNVDNLWIVDGGSCGFGIESTVVRIHEENNVEILRRGGIGRDELIACLVDSGVFSGTAEAQNSVKVIERFVGLKSSLPSMVSPGQMLVHYSPRIMMQMVQWSSYENTVIHWNAISSERLRKTILIDFSGMFSALTKRVEMYRDLSQSGSSMEAAHELFSTLRWAENSAGEDHEHWQIWIFDPRALQIKQTDELFLALSDRIYRAAAGRAIRICIKPNSDQVFSSVH